MTLTKPVVIVLLGPTASGKTELALEIAEKLGLGIHNIDSRQIYEGMDIGTAKPSKDQQKRIKHFLIDICHPNKPITLHEFQKKAESSLKRVLSTQKIGFLVGGSGLYLQALTSGLLPPAVAPQSDLRLQLSKLGQSNCHKLLQNCDPIAANRIAPADAIRTIRALEVIYATGKPISSQQKANPPNWEILELGLDPSNLNERIFSRTIKIYENGLLEETAELSNKFGEDLPLLQTIGYKEALKVIKGKFNLSEAIDVTNRRTSQFAKRQRTWFKRKHNPQWLNDEQPLREALSLIQAVLG